MHSGDQNVFAAHRDATIQGTLGKPLLEAEILFYSTLSFTDAAEKNGRTTATLTLWRAEILMLFERSVPFLVVAVVWATPIVSVLPRVLAADSPAPATQPDLSAFPPQVKFTGDGDHRNMMEQLGIKAL